LRVDERGRLRKSSSVVCRPRPDCRSTSPRLGLLPHVSRVRPLDSDVQRSRPYLDRRVTAARRFGKRHSAHSRNWCATTRTCAQVLELACPPAATGRCVMRWKNTPSLHRARSGLVLAHLKFNARTALVVRPRAGACEVSARTRLRSGLLSRGRKCFYAGRRPRRPTGEPRARAPRPSCAPNVLAKDAVEGMQVVKQQFFFPLVRSPSTSHPVSGLLRPAPTIAADAEPPSWILRADSIRRAGRQVHAPPLCCTELNRTASTDASPRASQSIPPNGRQQDGSHVAGGCRRPLPRARPVSARIAAPSRRAGGRIRGHK
jgi:hypothetical protein